MHRDFGISVACSLLRRRSDLLQFLANGVCAASTVSVVALGFGLIYYVNRVFHIAHGAVYVTAGYVAFITLASWKVPILLALTSTVLASILMGVLIEITVYGPLVRRKASPAVTLVSSLGVYIAFVNFLAMCFGDERKILRPGVAKTIEFHNVIVTEVQVAQVAVALFVIVFLYCFLFGTRYGRLGRAIADNPTLASVLGINVTANRILVAGLGSALAGLAAFLASLHAGIDPTIGFSVVLAATVACIIGGIGNFLAPALGALFIGILESLTVWQFSGKWSSATTFCLLILFLIFRPQGFLGAEKRVTES